MLNGLRHQANVLKKALSLGMRAFRHELRWHKTLCGSSKFSAAPCDSLEIEGDYFATTDDGVFRMRRNRIENVCKIPAFGIAVSGDDLYLATWKQGESIVLRGDRQALLNPNSWYEFKPIYQVRVPGHGARIHQISVRNEFLWLANTARNSLTKINRFSGEWLAEISPCSYFGVPLFTDHNHVNSVNAFDHVVLFTALRRDRETALIGICGNGIVRGYAYPNYGLHDVHITERRVLVSDSYWFDGTAAGGGALVENGEPIDRDYFQRERPTFVRGMAGTDDETVFGNSFAAERAERFRGTGSVMVAKENQVVNRVALPTAQIYDIIHTDGTSFRTPPALNSFDAICAAFQSQFGDPVIESALNDALIVQGASGFERPIGDIPELNAHIASENAA